MADAEEAAAQAMPGTRGLSYDDLNQFRVDQHGRLIWRGDLVQVQRKLTLSTWQAVFAGAAAVGAVLQGILALYDLGTRVGWWSAMK